VKRIFIAAALAATVATPAFAQDAAPANPFAGARIGAEIGVADEDIFGTELFTYGLEAGYDFDIGGKAVAGPTIGIQDSDDTGREFSAGVRGGVNVGSNALIYGAAAYSNLKAGDFKLHGVRFGVGVEFAPAQNVYVKAEQRYGNYEMGAELYQTVLGVGFRF
jgi:outer membrane immunogenic protein